MRAALLLAAALVLMGCNVSQYDPVTIYKDGERVDGGRCYVASVGGGRSPLMVYCETH